MHITDFNIYHLRAQWERIIHMLFYIYYYKFFPLILAVSWIQVIFWICKSCNNITQRYPIITLNRTHRYLYIMQFLCTSLSRQNMRHECYGFVFLFWTRTWYLSLEPINLIVYTAIIKYIYSSTIINCTN